MTEKHVFKKPSGAPGSDKRRPAAMRKPARSCGVPWRPIGKPLKSASRIRQLLGVTEHDNRRPNRVMYKIQLNKLADAELLALRDNLQAWAGAFISTLCSGSDVFVVALKEICDILRVNCPQVKATCEQEERKAKWLHLPHEIIYDSDICVHRDIGEMCQTHGACHFHKGSERGCPIQRGSSLVSVGFSCKNFSKLFSNSNFQLGTNWLETREKSIGETFDGLLSFLLAEQPEVVQLENVPELAEERFWTVCKRALAEAGYTANIFGFNSKAYGVPSVASPTYQSNVT